MAIVKTLICVDCGKKLKFEQAAPIRLGGKHGYLCQKCAYFGVPKVLVPKFNPRLKDKVKKTGKSKAKRVGKDNRVTWGDILEKINGMRLKRGYELTEIKTNVVGGSRFYRYSQHRSEAIAREKLGLLRKQGKESRIVREDNYFVVYVTMPLLEMENGQASFFNPGKLKKSVRKLQCHPKRKP